MKILDILMIGAFALFLVFMLRGVALQTQERERKRVMKNSKKESKK